jgi:hypothetical protein
MGRPQFKPTEEQRSLVKSMAAVGIPHDLIARRIELHSAKTLRKHFRRELDIGETDANYKVGQTLFKMATSGSSVAAAIFWAKTRMGWREREPDEIRHAELPPFIVARETGRTNP